MNGPESTDSAPYIVDQAAEIQAEEERIKTAARIAVSAAIDAARARIVAETTAGQTEQALVKLKALVNKLCILRDHLHNTQKMDASAQIAKDVLVLVDRMDSRIGTLDAMPDIDPDSVSTHNPVFTSLNQAAEIQAEEEKAQGAARAKINYMMQHEYKNKIDLQIATCFTLIFNEILDGVQQMNQKTEIANHVSLFAGYVHILIESAKSMMCGIDPTTVSSVAPICFDDRQVAKSKQAGSTGERFIVRDMGHARARKVVEPAGGFVRSNGLIDRLQPLQSEDDFIRWATLSALAQHAHGIYTLATGGSYQDTMFTRRGMTDKSAVRRLSPELKLRPLGYKIDDVPAVVNTVIANTRVELTSTNCNPDELASLQIRLQLFQVLHHAMNIYGYEDPKFITVKAEIAYFLSGSLKGYIGAIQDILNKKTSLGNSENPAELYAIRHAAILQMLDVQAPLISLASQTVNTASTATDDRS